MEGRLDSSDFFLDCVKIGSRSRLMCLLRLLADFRDVVVCSLPLGLADRCEDGADGCKKRTQDHQPCAQWIERS